MASGDIGRINLDSLELSLIDSGIQSMKDVPLSPHLQSLNLHSNYIQHIQGLELMHNLKHLDISANQIDNISGLESLISLKTLNLSCNLITVVQGLSALRSLVKLNLSYNQIEDISGLRSLAGSDYKLSQLELHGNRLRSLTHVQHSLRLCSNLRHLILSQDGSSNPVCHQEGYQTDLFTAFPQLETLNGIDRQGRRTLPPEIGSNVPELEAYLDFLLSGGSTNTSTASEGTRSTVKTPRIDEVLAKFRLQGATSAGPSISSAATSGTEAESSPRSAGATPGKPQAASRMTQARFTTFVADQYDRLSELEEEVKRLQLAQHKVGPSGRTPRTNSSASSSRRDDTEEEVEPVRERNTAGDNVAKSQQKPNLGQAQRKQTPTPAVTPTTLIKAQTKRGSARKQRSVREPGKADGRREHVSSSSPNVTRWQRQGSGRRETARRPASYLCATAEGAGDGAREAVESGARGPPAGRPYQGRAGQAEPSDLGLPQIIISGCQRSPQPQICCTNGERFMAEGTGSERARGGVSVQQSKPVRI
ncbi:hypothetical protein C0Q70_18951 [Pomacea canaliculata]|uniref:Leucine-rich repeat and coiled-coil domain-containing protein 1 n=1 Tax=Pomacea canaliculata TaxID=400727 RepID=A0A2T7NHY6_POMCA|nr:hypothetical protein C0Q70_18951 [Pomacea canaliculata]